MTSPDRSSSDFKYWAFISYSHSDEKWAKWLHRKLETYRVPAALVRQGEGRIPKRMFPIFRDREELASAPDLPERIDVALNASRNLIVLCSPRSAQSKWVNKEIVEYKALGRSAHVYCIIIEGEPHADPQTLGEEECFPDAVKFEVDENGALTETRAEPLAADARDGKDGRENAMLKVAAGMLGVGYDDLRQREKERQRRRRRNQIVAGVASALILGVLGWFAWLSGGTIDWDPDNDPRVVRKSDTNLEVYFDPDDAGTIPELRVRMEGTPRGVKWKLEGRGASITEAADGWRVIRIAAGATGTLGVRAILTGKELFTGRIALNPDPQAPVLGLLRDGLGAADLEDVLLTLTDANGDSAEILRTSSAGWPPRRPLRKKKVEGIRVLTSSRVSDVSLSGASAQSATRDPNAPEWTLAGFPLAEGRNDLTLAIVDFLGRKYERNIMIPVDNVDPPIPAVRTSVDRSNPGNGFVLTCSAGGGDERWVRIGGTARQKRGMDTAPPPDTISLAILGRRPGSEGDEFVLRQPVENPFGTYEVSVGDAAGNWSDVFEVSPVAHAPVCELLFDEVYASRRKELKENCPGGGGFVQNGSCCTTVSSRFGPFSPWRAMGLNRNEDGSLPSGCGGPTQSAGVYAFKGGLVPPFTVAIWVLVGNGGTAFAQTEAEAPRGQPDDAGPFLGCGSRMSTFRIPKTGSAGDELVLRDDTDIERGEWAFYVVTAARAGRGTIAALYRDGRFVTSAEQVGDYRTSIMSDTWVAFGNADIDDSNGELTGAVDDVRIWNRALEGEDIAALYIESASSWKP